jgi:hypothetical protein
MVFGASAVSAKSAPQPLTAEMEAMRKELQRTKDCARLRAMHGPQLTDDQINEMLADEADMVVRKVKAAEVAEATRLEEIRRDVEIRKLACQLVRDGKMLISLDGTRLTDIDPTLTITCPRCGKALGSLSGAIYEFAKMWFWIPEGNRVDQFKVYSARNPLGDIIGVMAYDGRLCPHCKEQTGAFLQMVMI